MKALILIDLQNDFLPGGALAVPDGDRAIPVANRLAEEFELVVATQDWHPADHGSFAANHSRAKVGQIIDLNRLQQVLWPVHCVRGTAGADFSPDLRTERIHCIIRKGTDPSIDSYSGFFDNGHRRTTGLGGFLKEHGVTDVFVMGLATDYCVKFTALDAARLGFKVHLITDGCRGVNLKPGDVDAAMAEMKKACVFERPSTEL